MTHILSILRAAHCRSTHHFFALDALRNLKTAQAQRLGYILLKYHDDYLLGAKAPDCSFKDFQNHVIHVGDNNWGGAPQKCLEWQAQAREYLDHGKWKKAAYACGVLSHYFTDPIMPLHTAQHPREQLVHRPLEWSICQSYNEIYNQCIEASYECEFELAVDDLWIAKAVLAAAAVAHRHYDLLVASYDVARGVAKPREGLNDEAMTILAELFAVAIGGWSRVLTRLADETTKELPQVSLALTSVLATIDMPLAWIVGRISDSQERRAVQALFNEYRQNGNLKRYLPAEIAVVGEAKIAEPNLGIQLPGTANTSIASPNLESTAPNESRKLEDIELPGEKLATVETDTVEQATSPHLDSSAASATERALAVTPESAPCPLVATSILDHVLNEQQGLEDQPVSKSEEVDLPQFLSLSQARGRLRVQAEPSTTGQARRIDIPEIGVASTVAESIPHETLRIAPGTMLRREEEQNTVHYGSPVVDAPSIGPKTAKRFENIGITTIRQLISTSPDVIVSGLATRWITENLVQDWQDQARLVCEVPALSGYRAQLLVAVGCRTAWQLRSANPTSLAAQISQFCQTSEGQQILRSARIPQADEISNWIESAKIFERRNVA